MANFTTAAAKASKKIPPIHSSGIGSKDFSLTKDGDRMERTTWCKCSEPDLQSGTIHTSDGVKSHIDYVVCGRCDQPIKTTGVVSDLDTDRVEVSNEFEFAASAPRFDRPINPWVDSRFAGQTNWLLRKRAECLADLLALRSLLEKLSTVAHEERKGALTTILRQAGGTFSEIDRIENLIENINPTFDFSTLPALPFQPKNHKDLLPIPKRAGYYTEVRHAA